MDPATTQRGADGVYRNAKSYNLLDIDLLSLLFDSSESASQEETKIHISAKNPSNYLTKASIRVLLEKIAYSFRNDFSIGASGPYKDVVVTMTTGQILAPVIFYSTIAAGGVFSAASPSFTPPELARQIRQGSASLLVCSPDLKDVAFEAARMCNLPLSKVIIIQSDPSISVRSADGKIDSIGSKRLTWKRISNPQELDESLIVLLYSSGTTGVPKGVMISHRNLVSELLLLSWPAREWAAANIPPGTETPPLRTLAHLPVAHIAGVFGYFIASVFGGISVYWMGKFQFDEFIELAKTLEITTLYTVPSIYLRIVKSPKVKDHFKTLQGASTGAAKMDGELQKAANRKLGVGAVFIGQTWGLSETTGAVTAMPPGASDATGSISPVLPNVELRCVDEKFKDVEPGQPGELVVKGPIVTRGYFANHEATKDSFRDGWFCSGDIAVENGGKFYIVDRKKEIIKYKGLQVAPAELETLLNTHPHIQESAIVGVPVEGTEVPRAYIVADPNKVSEKDVKDFVAKNLAPYKQLRGGVAYVKDLPKNAIGKILRTELRVLAKKELQSGTPKL